MEQLEKWLKIDNLGLFSRHPSSEVEEIDEKYYDKYSILIIDFISNDNIIESNGNQITNTVIQSKLPKLTDTYVQELSIFGKVAQGVLVLVQAIFVFASPLYQISNFFDLIQMINYMIYINVQYPEFLYKVIKIFEYTNFEIIPNIKNDKSNSPYKFQLEQVDTFIYCNLIQSVAIWGASFILYLTALFLTNLLQKKSTNSIIKYIKEYKEKYTYQVIISLGFLTYCDLVLACFLQFYDNSEMTSLQIFGLVTSFILLSLIIWLNYVTFKATQINPYELYLNKRVNKVYGYFYNGLTLLNINPTINLVFLLRKTIIIYQLVFNQSSPLTQALVFCLAFGLESTFLVAFKPYKCRNEFIVNLTSRIILIFSYVPLIVLIIDDQLPQLSMEARDKIGIFISLMLITIYSFYFGHAINSIYKSFKLRINKNKVKIREI